VAYPTANGVPVPRGRHSGVASRDLGIEGYGSYICRRDVRISNNSQGHLNCNNLNSNNSQGNLNCDVPMGPYGALWGPMEPCEALWGPMGAYGGLWGPMGPYGSLWGPMDTCGALMDRNISNASQ
jgi:hypothetical protein